MAHDVFVSYSRRDKPVADAVCASLERQAIRCWMAPRDILPGSVWSEAIITALESARLLVVVFSSGANASQQVMREVERAVSRGLPVLPFRIEDVELAKPFQYFLGVPHWLDAITPPLGYGQSITDSWAVWGVTSALIVAGAVLLLPVIVRLYYRFRKCGVVLWVREGVHLYVFTDRRLLVRANRLYRTLLALRENRLTTIGMPIEPGKVGELRTGHAGVAMAGSGDIPPSADQNHTDTIGVAPSRRGALIVTLGALLLVAGGVVPAGIGGATTDQSPTGLPEAPTSAAASAKPSDFGDDPALDALWNRCAAGDGNACVDLYVQSPSGSAYERYGDTCGDRVPAGTRPC